MIVVEPSNLVEATLPLPAEGAYGDVLPAM
jgi:hypothetical protein